MITTRNITLRQSHHLLLLASRASLVVVEKRASLVAVVALPARRASLAVMVENQASPVVEVAASLESLAEAAAAAAAAAVGVKALVGTVPANLASLILHLARRASLVGEISGIRFRV